MAALRQRWVILLILGYGATGCSDGAATISPAAPTTTLTAPPAVEFTRGWVRDTAFRPLSGAQIELLTGPQAGVVATTDSTGEFSFTATVDDGSRLRASKEGHMSAEVTLGPVCNGCPGRSGRSLAFYLHVPTAPAAIAGDYTLTFTADGACTTLPENLRSRTYEVTITPTPSRFGVSLDPATAYQVAPRAGIFPGRIRFFWVDVAGNFVALRFGDPFDPAVIEAVAPDGHVAFSGRADVSVVDSLTSVVTPFTGTIEYCVNPEISEDGYRCTAPPSRRARCDSDNHLLALIRR